MEVQASPSASHQGGVLERLERTFERILNTIVGTRCLTDEVLKTTFCLVEYELIVRPITTLSADPSDQGAIKPNHFLLGHKANGNTSIVSVDEFDYC